VAGNIDGAVGFWPIAEQQHRAGQLAPGANMLQPPAVVLHGCHRWGSMSGEHASFVLLLLLGY
jgi:hypothetical protein